MLKSRSAVATLVGVAVGASLAVTTWKPLTVHAIAAPGIISTYAGGAASGPGPGLAQTPWGLAVSGSTLYIADFDDAVVRALNTGSGIETIVAGTSGASGDSGQGGLATAAKLNEPAAVAVDGSGNLFISSYGRVQRVDHSTGIITAVAGTGVTGYTGDGGLATAAQVSVVWGLAVDSANNVLIADTSNHRIRRVDHATGIITTIAGGAEGFLGDGGPATGARFDFPMGLAIDAGDNIFVADNVNHRIREISGGNINTVAGTTQGFAGDAGPATSAKLGAPRGVFVDASGNLWIADTFNSRIREVVAGTINTVVGNGVVGSGGDGGPPLSAQLNSPYAAIVDGSGNLFISDYYAKRLRKVSGGTINTAAGTGTVCSKSGDGGAATAATLCNPVGLATDTSGDLFIVDQGNNVIREVNSGGIISTFAGTGAYGATGDGGSATAATLGQPSAVAVNGSGDLFIADTGNNVVRKVSGGTITLVAGNYTAGLSGDGGAATAAQLNRPTGLAFDSSGNLYIADDGNTRIRKVAGGVISTYAGTTYGNSGDGGPATSAQLKNPYSIAIDSLDNLYINDYDIGNIRKVTTGGTISEVAAVLARQVAIGPGDRIITSSDFTQQISLVTTGGVFPLAGTGAQGFSGDGGLATAAQLYYPWSVAVDSGGNIYIGDYHNQRIRRVQAFTLPTAPLSVSATPGAYTAKVKWSAPASAGGLPITWYVASPSGGGTSQGRSGAPPLEVTVDGLNLGTSYTFTVTARTAWGTGPASAPSNAIVPLAVDPGGIRTNAGSPGYGPATSLGQAPFAVAVAGSQLLVGDFANPVARSVNLSNGLEGVFAGNDSYGYSGDGGPSAAAMIVSATAVAYCGTDIYIADGLNYVIRKINGSGVITTVAGTGRAGLSGDGGPATKARLSRVLGIACRSGGGLYISDTDNGRVRILDASGNIDTWWFGFGFPTGIVETGGLDQVDVSDTAANKVWELSDFTAIRVAGLASGAAGSSGDGGPATSAELNGPTGLAYAPDYSRLYIADTFNNKVRMVTGTTITTLAGTGIAGFTDNVQSASAQFDQPIGISIVPHAFLNGISTVYVADSNNYRVRKIDPGAGSTVTTVAGNGTPSLSGDGGQAPSAQLGNPYDIAFDAAGNEYLADNQNAVIRKITPSGVISTFAGNGVSGYSGDGGTATSAMLNDPRGVAVNGAGDVYISDSGNQRIRKVDHSSGNITTVAGNGFIGSVGDGGPGTSAEVNFPNALVVDASGNLYIADGDNNKVRMLTTGGTISTFAGTGVAGFGGDGGLATAAQLNGPRGLAIDASGNVVIADMSNHRVRRVANGTGLITTIAGTGVRGLSGDLHPAAVARLASPHGLAFDSAGNLYIADTGNQRIRAIDTHGIIRSVVGVCGIVAAFSGDGGPADLAHVNTPYGLATDGLDNLFIAEVNSNRVRIASITPGARGNSCQGAAGSSGSRTVISGLSGGSPGARIPRYGPGSRVPLTSTTLAAIAARPTHAATSRSSAPVTAPRTKPPGAKQVSPQTAPQVSSGSKMAVATQTPYSTDTAWPLYASLLVPLGLLLAALVVQLRRRRLR